MHPTITHFIMLGAFMLGAKFFSFLAKRPVDGAFGYLVTTGVLVLIAVIQIFNPDVVPSNERAYVLGTLTAALALPVGLALYLSIQHNARRRAALINPTSPHISATSPAEAPAEPSESVTAPPLKAPWYLPLLMLGWQLRSFWNGGKSLAAAFWGLGVVGTLVMFFVVVSAADNDVALLLLLPLFCAHLVVTVKAIWACSANTRHKAFGDIAKTLLVLFPVVAVLRYLGLL